MATLPAFVDPWDACKQPEPLIRAGSSCGAVSCWEAVVGFFQCWQMLSPCLALSRQWFKQPLSRYRHHSSGCVLYAGVRKHGQGRNRWLRSALSSCSPLGFGEDGFGFVFVSLRHTFYQIPDLRISVRVNPQRVRQRRVNQRRIKMVRGPDAQASRHHGRLFSLLICWVFLSLILCV